MSNPYAGFRFVVELNGAEVGGFSQVSGLERSTAFEEFREGGVNGFKHKLASLSSYPNLRLVRGITDAVDLWQWHQDVIAGDISLKSISVILKDSEGSERWRWVFEQAYPVKWNGSDLDAATNTVMTESVEFAHHGMRKL